MEGGWAVKVWDRCVDNVTGFGCESCGHGVDPAGQEAQQLCFV